VVRLSPENRPTIEAFIDAHPEATPTELVAALAAIGIGGWDAMEVVYHRPRKAA
jgi:hypothetical protein